jgi:hypothetical protein
MPGKKDRGKQCIESYVNEIIFFFSCLFAKHLKNSGMILFSSVFGLDDFKINNR